MGRIDWESETLIPTRQGGFPSDPIAIQERAICENPDAGPDGVGVRTDGLAYTLEARQVPQAVAFSCKDSGADVGEISPTLRAMSGKLPNGGGQVAVALRGREGGATAELGDDKAFALRASSGGGDKPHALLDMAVRRLTPMECERLQGMPDHYTMIPRGKKPAHLCPDGPRYKAIGNSMAVPCMRWIGQRIDRVHRAHQLTMEDWS